MAVENRVRDLENEVKILKNEIKTILLNIQDHVLTHYSSPFVAAPASQAAAKEEEANSGGTQSATFPGRGSLTALDKSDEVVADIPAPDNGVGRTVPDKIPEIVPTSVPDSMGELMRDMMRPDRVGDSGGSMSLIQTFSGRPETFSGTPGTLSGTPEAFSGTPETLSGTPGGSFSQHQGDEAWLGSLKGDVDLPMLSKLSAWVNKTSQTLGGKRAKTILDTYAMTGLISPKVVKLLELFVSFDGKAPKGKVSNKAVITALLNLDRTLGRKVDATAVALSLLLDGD